MRTALVIGGRPDYAGPAVRILPRTGARVYLSERWKVDDLINNNDRQQQHSTNKGRREGRHMISYTMTVRVSSVKYHQEK